MSSNRNAGGMRPACVTMCGGYTGGRSSGLGISPSIIRAVFEQAVALRSRQ